MVKEQGVKMVNSNLFSDPVKRMHDLIHMSLQDNIIITTTQIDFKRFSHKPVFF